MWAKKCRQKVKVLVALSDGGTATKYAPREGGYVALKKPGSETTRVWPISKVCIVEMLYPGDGFIPTFMQSYIKMVIVDEEDWEPLLNRGSYTENVASPDVVRKLRALVESIAEKQPVLSKQLDELASGLTTAPTRELVASPAVLGNITHERVTEAVLTVNQVIMDKIENLLKGLKNVLSPTVLYIGFGLVLIGLVVLGMKTLPLAGKVEDMQTSLDNIETALGIEQVIPDAR